jgi:hypothetical protein
LRRGSDAKHRANAPVARIAGDKYLVVAKAVVIDGGKAVSADDELLDGVESFLMCFVPTWPFDFTSLCH